MGDLKLRVALALVTSGAYALANEPMKTSTRTSQMVIASASKQSAPAQASLDSRRWLWDGEPGGR